MSERSVDLVHYLEEGIDDEEAEEFVNDISDSHNFKMKGYTYDKESQKVTIHISLS